MKKQTKTILILLFTIFIFVTGILNFLPQDYSLNKGEGFYSQVFKITNVFFRPMGVVLIISTTLVAIAVPLTANIYTPKLIDLFLQDRFNWLVYGFFFAANIIVIIGMMLVSSVGNFKILTFLSYFLSISCLALFIPYCRYVLQFLDPSGIIKLLKKSLYKRLDKVSEKSDIEEEQHEILKLIENISNFSMRSVERADAEIGHEAFWSFREICSEYYRIKKTLPEKWHIVDRRHFVNLNLDTIKWIEEKHLVLEAAILNQVFSIFNHTLNRFDDMTNSCVILPRKIARLPVKADDGEALRLILQYYNTMLRATINNENIRICNQIFRQYSLMAMEIMEKYPEKSEKIVHYLKYYAVRVFYKKMYYTYNIAVLDIAEIIYYAYANKYEVSDMMINDLVKLTLDLPEEEKTFNSVTPFLFLISKLNSEKITQHNEKIEKILMRFSKDLLLGAIDKLCSITESQYWEISDRDSTIDYLPEEAREFLKNFKNKLK